MTRVAPVISLFLGMMVVICVLPGCGGAKYSAMDKEARSELSLMAQAEDDLHNLDL